MSPLTLRSGSKSGSAVVLRSSKDAYQTALAIVTTLEERFGSDEDFAGLYPVGF